MVIGAGLFVLSLWNARHQDFGMELDRLAVVSTNLFELGRPMENHAIHRLMQARISSLPQVEATALIENRPMQGASFGVIEVPGKELFKGAFSSDSLPASNGVDPAFFRVTGMRLIQGRFFTDEENRKGARPVAVVTETMARNIWPGEAVLGKCFYQGGMGNNQPCTEIVGVVADARLFPSIRPTKQWASAYYIPIEQQAITSSRALLVRCAGKPAKVLRALRLEAQAASADLPYVGVVAFDEVFLALLRPWRLGSIVFVGFGALSMIIAAVGLAVVGAYAVTRRTREIGIRSALGAAPHQLVRLVLRRSVFTASVGLAMGTGLALVGGRLLSAQLFDVHAHDGRVHGLAIAVLLLVAVCAAWIPARRAARIEPVVALRVE
jgi:predicted permease